VRQKKNNKETAYQNITTLAQLAIILDLINPYFNKKESRISFPPNTLKHRRIIELGNAEPLTAKDYLLFSQIRQYLFDGFL